MLPYDIESMNHRVLDVFPKPKYVDGKRTDEQDTNSQGIPLWSVQVKLLFEDQHGDPTNEIIRITIPGTSEPTNLKDHRIKAENLLVGSSPGGLYFRADAVTALQNAKSA